MNKLKPFKGATIGHISQGFHDAHKANDITSKMGTWLVPPEDCKVSVIVTDTNFNESLTPLSRGYGIGFWSLDGRRKYSDWHCLGIFPVKVGDIVRRGKPLAQMGNSGFVKSGGIIVPLKTRYKKPYKGVHTHRTFKIDGVLVDMSKYINWSLSVEYSILDQIKAMIIVGLKMMKLLK